MDDHARFKWPIGYDSYKIIDDENNYIRVYENVVIGNVESDDIQCFNGTNLIITCTPHYFHYLKEYFASFLHYKHTYDHSAKYLWVENYAYVYPKHQQMCDVCEWTESFIKKDCAGNIDVYSFNKSCYIIERLVVVFDGQQILADYQDKFKDYTKTPGLNNELRYMFLEKAKYPEKKQEKIFISRRVVSKQLDEWKFEHPVNSDWLKEQRRLRYNEDWVEEEIESVFIENGYSIIQPSGMPMDEQIGLFASATHVAGILGTGFYNGLFCKRGTKFIGITIHPDYWYPFEDDIKSVVDVEFRYIDIFNHMKDRRAVRRHVARCMLRV
jgi:hypothetical protein